MPPRHHRKPRPAKPRAVVDPPHIAAVCGWCKAILAPADAARDAASPTIWACKDRAACCARLAEQAEYERARSEG